MDFEEVKKQRTRLRKIFTRKTNLIKNMLDVAEPDTDSIVAAIETLEPRVQELFDYDERIYNHLVSGSDEQAVDEDMDQADDYRINWIALKRKVDRLTSYEIDAYGSRASYKSVSSCNNHDGSAQRRHFNLPKLELKKFDGNVRSWIGFWGQFKKIHEDLSSDKYDKFQYLTQAMEENTSAKSLIESFPPAAENYDKAVIQLKERFARDNLLIDVYVRDLLNLILSQVKQNQTLSLTSLYDKLTTQLRALETLGVTSDKYAAMLLPLVESALPVDILKAYERYRTVNSNISTDDTGKQLFSLLLFLQKEIESNERIIVAKASFNNDDAVQLSLEPTASCFLTGDSKVSNRVCIWCDKPSHSSSECSKLSKMTYEEKRDIIKKKKGCAICLRTGHHAKVCKLFIKCLICSRRHSTVMCPDINRSDKKQEDQKETSPSLPNTTAVMSSSQVTAITMLQTVIVNVIDINSKKISVRALIDSGAQRSYIKEDLVERLGLTPVSELSLIHQLFGGVERQSSKHRVYKICIQNTDGSFKLNMTTLSEIKICGSIPSVSSNLSSRLKHFDITLSNVSNDKEISLLIGADYASYIMTGTFIQIQDGLVAIKTKLGWCLQGKVEGNYDFRITTLFSKTELDIMDMWNLEAIRIRDKPTHVTDMEVLYNFKGNLSVNNQGRYETSLPWKHDRTILSSNRDLAEKRLLSTTKRLKNLNKLNDYDNVFKEWLQLGIIEKVDYDDGRGHYLAHHAVIKESSVTTKIRPVFDASAKGKNKYSLNSCLEKGINLIELIPVLLTRFRMHAVGISSDIAKAFLQISLIEKDREYLKFLWWRDVELKEIITFRHCRVVFGLTCSLFFWPEL